MICVDASPISFRNPMIFPRDLLGELSTFQRHGRDLQGRRSRRIGHQPSTPHLDVIQDPEIAGFFRSHWMWKMWKMNKLAMYVPRNILCISEKCVCTLAIEIHKYICSYMCIYIHISYIISKNELYIYIYCVEGFEVCHVIPPRKMSQVLQGFFGQATRISITGPSYAPGISGSVTFMFYSMTNHGGMICYIQYGMRYVSIYIYIHICCVNHIHIILIYIYIYVCIYIMILP